jgi:hypothetical protein
VSHRFSRGQAVFETAAVMPVFLIALLGVLWTMKESSLSERVHMGVRYSGMVSSLQQPYESYSLYAMYAAIDDVVPADVSACYAGAPSQLTSGFASFWQPTSTAPIVSPCVSSVVIVNGPETYSQPVILRNDYASLFATAPVGGFLSHAVFSGQTTTGLRAAENFFRSPNVGSLLTCTTLGPAVKLSLEGRTDPSTYTAPMTGGTGSIPVTSSTPLPLNVTVNSVVTGTGASCATPAFTVPAAPY